MKLPKRIFVNNGQGWEITDKFWEREYKQGDDYAGEPITNDSHEIAFHCKTSDLERLGIDLETVKHEPDPFDEEKVYIYGEHEKTSDFKYLFKPYFIKQEGEQ